jgi:hypothetical protein
VHASGTTTDSTYLPEGTLDTLTVTAPASVQRLHLDYAVDALQGVTSLAEQHASSDPVEGYVFGYDAAGNRDDDPGVATCRLGECRHSGGGWSAPEQLHYSRVWRWVGSVAMKSALIPRALRFQPAPRIGGWEL